MINVVTAPEHRYFPPKSLKVFLAGGICKCIQWQDLVIESFLKEDDYRIQLSEDFDDLYLLNPRRQEWLDKPGDVVRQIEWEFDMLERCDIFTMYFAGGESYQPICMYELGRNIEKMKQRFPESWENRIIITCDKSYRLVNDVEIQVRLATDGLVKPNIVDGDKKSVNAHYMAIKDKLKYIYFR